MRGAVIIPAYNEATTIGSVLDRLAAEKVSAEVVVVDDGSLDGTAAVAAAHGATVISHALNLGYTAAIRTGILYALRLRYDFCVTLDADEQHDPRYVPQLIARAAASDRPDVIIGSRFVAARRYDAPAARRLGMVVFSVLTRALAGYRIYDTTSGLKWLSRRAMETMAGLDAADFHSEMIIYAVLRGLSVVETPVVMGERRSGHSMHGLLSAIVYPTKTLLSIAVLLMQARTQGRVDHR